MGLVAEILGSNGRMGLSYGPSFSLKEGERTLLGLFVGEQAASNSLDKLSTAFT